MSKHITGHTGLLCLLGSPVAHSVSPEMHNEACDQLGLDYTYLAFDVPEDKMPEAVMKQTISLLPMLHRHKQFYVSILLKE